jgi:transposase
VSDSTSLPVAVVADTIVRTVELGVTITDAAVDGDVTVVFCNLLDDGQRQCPGCGVDGVYRDTAIRSVTDVPVVGHPLRLRVRVPRYRCVTWPVSGKCSPTTPIGSPGAAGRPRGGVPATSAAG